MEDNYMSDKFEDLWEKLNEENDSLENKLIKKTSELYELFQNAAKTAAPKLKEAILSQKFILRDDNGRSLDVFKLDDSDNFYIEIPNHNQVFNLQGHTLGKIERDENSKPYFRPFTQEEANFFLRNKDFWESLSAILLLQVLENDINFKSKQLKDLPDYNNNN
jgi:hypothetical protein